MPKKLLIAFLITSSLILNLVSVIYFLNHRNIPHSGKENNKYHLLAKRLLVEDNNDFFLNFQPLRRAVNEYIEKQTDTKIQYYFEYLPSGITIGVNERDILPSGSLVKTPGVLAIYKKIEKGELKETDEVALKAEFKDKEFGDFWQKPTGTKITIDEAIRLTLSESDNTTFRMILSLLSDKEIKEAYESTDLYFEPTEEGIRPYVSPKSYSSVFKALYLSVYLNPENSNKILQYLSESEFNAGILRHISPSPTVAHKIGVVRFDDEPVYSDCGIVYAPKRPYIICIMVHDEEEKALEHIAMLSRMTYEYITLPQNNK